jgi:phage tail protein X
VVKAKPGDSLDKLIAAQYKNSPLRVDILRGAVLAANPILAGTAVRLKAGQEVVLPAHKDIVVAVLGALIPAAAPAAPAETHQAPEPMQRRDWIRYP